MEGLLYRSVYKSIHGQHTETYVRMPQLPDWFLRLVPERKELFRTTLVRRAVIRFPATQCVPLEEIGCFEGPPRSNARSLLGYQGLSFDAAAKTRDVNEECHRAAPKTE
jgi:hypothetical protein